MFAVIKNGKFNGVTYSEISRSIVSHHEKYGETISKPSSPIKINGQEDYRAVENDELMAFVRDYRVILLAEVDWTQTLDCPLTDEKKAEFAVYRQALRDIPQTHPDPQSIVWPTKPTI